MADEIKNIFVSHHHNDADKIEAFKNLIGRHGIDMNRARLIVPFMKKS